MNKEQRQLFASRLMGYLVLIGGPDGPQDSPTNPRSHWRLQSLYQEYGRNFINDRLDAFFKEHPNW